MKKVDKKGDNIRGIFNNSVYYLIDYFNPIFIPSESCLMFYE